MSKAWFFDLDGTLADTDRDIREAWKAAMSDLGLKRDDFDAVFVAGPPIDVMLQNLFPAEYTPELVAKMREAFGRHYDHDGFPNTREYPGVLDRVRRLKAAGDRVFIVTNKRHAGAAIMGRKFGWDKVFEKLYTGDMYGVKKPELIAIVLREQGLQPESCVMVGDTLNDFTAARANQVSSVGVAWGYGTPDELRAADRMIERIDDL
ncbi:MAG: HAD family hydrolase [Kiritimatiellae bacterium]|nr:HAD family hydrolase [Kiritimatiellia bacterium]